ncbi:MAG: HEAT repeat domain-containing protein [Candidatus Eisenbacteria bacterium]|uniref:HEAT repeat domain-containing protein n=1 Tax=Eiseniibacteriota bacterium TaxID=2212470 RepID=A0A7Y2EDX5_UNCEI|nr:HEAT repeat domain-containing protein [Candidatus Eisenbacteria bacterium]
MDQGEKRPRDEAPASSEDSCVKPNEVNHEEPSAWFEPNEPEGLRDAFAVDGTAPQLEEAPLDESVLEPTFNINRVGQDPPPVFATESDEEERGDLPPDVARVEALVGALAKAVKATQLYPPENPMCLRFTQVLAKEFDATFDELSEVRLTVGKTKFFYKGETVLEQLDREDSIPGRFFWDGIREITFREGLEEDEVAGFLEVCHRSNKNAETGEEDLVTLMWDREFEHIACIAVDDILDLENPDDPVPEEFGTEYMNFIDLEMHDLEAEENEVMANEFAEEIRSRLADNETNLFGVPTEDRDRVMEEANREEHASYMLDEILVIILETLYLDDQTASFLETVNVLGQAMESLIGDGRIYVAAGLMRMLREMRSERDDLNEKMKQGLDEALTQGWSQENCAAIVRHLNASLIDVRDAIEDYVEALPPEALTAVCDMLIEVESKTSREKMLRAISKAASNRIDLLIPYLENPDPRMVKDIVQVLGATQNDEALVPLRNMMRHPNVDVRGATLGALVQIGFAKSGDIILAALEDSDPKIRIAAVNSLGQAGRMGIGVLLQTVEDRKFRDRSLNEKKAFLRALAVAGGDEFVPYFTDMINKKSLFKRAQLEELRACATEALGWTGNPHIHTILEGYSKDKSKLVRGAAQAALRRLEGRESSEKEAA